MVGGKNLDHFYSYFSNECLKLWFVKSYQNTSLNYLL